MNIHTTGPCPAIPIQQGLKRSFAFSHAKKCDYNYLHPQMTLWLFSHSRIRFKKWPSLFSVAFCGSFPVFITDFVFLCSLLCFLFSARHSFLCHVLQTCHCWGVFLRAIRIGRLCLITSWVLSQVSAANNFFFTCYFLSPFPRPAFLLIS